MSRNLFADPRNRFVWKVRAELSALVLTIGVLTTSGCGNGSTVVPGPTPTPIAQFAYTANLMSGSLSGYSVDPSTGILTPLAGFPLPSGLNPVSVIHDPHSRFAIVADTAADVLRVYSINASSGMLTEVPPSPYPVEHEPRSLATDPTGKFIYVSSQALNSVTAFSMDTNGVLTPVQGSPFSTGGTEPSFGCCVVVDSTGKFVYVQDSANVYSFSIESATGALKLIGTTLGPGQGTGIALDPAGKFLYAVGAGSNSILTFAIDPTTGTLTPSTPSLLALHDGSYTICLDPSGRFAYTVEAGQTLVAYSVQNGILTSTGGTYSGALGSLQLAIDPTGSFLYAPQTGTANNVSGFRINASGTLSPLPGLPAISGQWPFSITITTK